MLAHFTLSACGPIETPGDTTDASSPRRSGVVATVNGEPIAVADLHDGMPTRSSLEERLDRAIDYALAAQEARRRALDEDPAVREAIERIRSQARRDEGQALREALHRALLAEVSFSESDLQRHHAETKARYFERQYRFRRMVYDTEGAALEAAVALGTAGHLDEQQAESIGPVVANDLPRDILPDALRMRTPGARAVIQGDSRWQLVELVEILPAEPQPFDAVRERVEASLRAQLAQAELVERIGQLRAEAVIDVDEAGLAAIERAAQPPPLD
jgi:hypothetical protein